MKELRGYQKDAINRLYSYWDATSSGNGVIVVPTGGGKSLLMASIIKDICTKWPGTRILILAHVKELIQQNYDELKSFWPQAPAGIFSAGIGRNDMGSEILIAGIQSIVSRMEELPPVEIVMVDEAHLIPRKMSTQYMMTLAAIKKKNQKVRVVGFSATPYRLDTGWLHRGYEAVFDQIVYDIPIQRLIDEGYLCSVTTRRGAVEIDTTGVRHSGGDFVAGELEDRALEGDVTERAVADMVERAKDRRKWLIFTCGIKHSHHVSELLTKHGISNRVIAGDMTKAFRDGVIREFKGEELTDIRALVNVNVLTTGFNAPAIDFIALMRPTESVGLYVQMVGRGTRTSDGKRDCLVADYAGLTLRHGPIDMVNPDTKPWTPGSGPPPSKECPECWAIIHASAKACPVCGYAFPPSELKIQSTPEEAPILASQIEPEEIEVTYTEYVLHCKTGRPNSVRIQYSYGFGSVVEWMFPESNSQWGRFFYEKACREMGLLKPYPRTAEDFLDRPGLPQAKRIWTIPEGQYTRVKKHEWIAPAKETFSDDIPF